MFTKKKSTTDFTFSALRSLALRHKALLTLAVLIRSAAIILTTLHPYFLAQLVVSSQDQERAFNYLLLLLFSGMIHAVLWHGSDQLHARKILPIINNFKHICFVMAWREDYQTFIEKPSGKIASYVNQLRQQCSELWFLLFWGVLYAVLAVPTYLVILVFSAKGSSILYLFFLGIALAVLTVLMKPMISSQRKLTDVVSSNEGSVYDSFANFVNVFSFRSQGKEIGRHAAQIDEVTTNNTTAALKIVTYWSTASFMVRIVFWSVVLLYNWYLYSSGQTEFATFVLTTTVLLDFTNQFWRIVENISKLTTVSSTLRESYTYLFPDQNIVETFYAQKDLPTPTPIAFEDSLHIDNVSFAYPDNSKQGVLHTIDLKIGKNEKIGIVGKSGSGKSTLIKILLGFYTPTTGSVLVDDQPVSSDQLSSLYAYVPQDTTLFQSSIFYNIAYGCADDVTLEQVKTAAAKAHISEFIESTPSGYETLVGERGITLSLGQRQRIAIARALLRESELLILDEATSALDSETEHFVQQSFESLWADKSVIAIAHRLSTLNNVDRIIVLHEGRIVEQGTKEDLLARDSYFAELWQRQREGMLVD